ncbi:hypothetical protein ACFQDG_11150 [Natronoarchaeum mannanilyticum]|uniref:DUF8060 domain-containing protein n=1 Tax=Natronoarchaeum mannanilyticum TaxID=926360 RepID=A0AAV3TA06_9EURY
MTDEPDADDRSAPADDGQKDRPDDENRTNAQTEPTANAPTETAATTEPMPDTHHDADERDRSTIDDADPDALFEDVTDADGSGAADRDPDGAADGLARIDDGPIATLYWAGLAAAVAFGGFALYRFYASVTTAIDVWVAADYEPLLQAAFNFAVLLGAAVVASLLVRRLRPQRA